jgi:hypothetical protein
MSWSELVTGMTFVGWVLIPATLLFTLAVWSLTD